MAEPLTDEQRDFAERQYRANPRFARYMVAPFVARTPWLEDDLVSAAHEALLDAARAYRGGVKFTSFWGKCIVRRAINAVRRDSNRPCQEGPRGASAVAAPVPAADPGFSAADLLALLPPRHAEVLRAHVLDGVPQARIARGQGLTTARVWQLNRVALEKLRAHPKVRALVRQETDP